MWHQIWWEKSHNVIKLHCWFLNSNFNNDNSTNLSVNSQAVSLFSFNFLHLDSCIIRNRFYLEYEIASTECANMLLCLHITDFNAESKLNPECNLFLLLAQHSGKGSFNWNLIPVLIDCREEKLVQKVSNKKRHANCCWWIHDVSVPNYKHSRVWFDSIISFDFIFRLQFGKYERSFIQWEAQTKKNISVQWNLRKHSTLRQNTKLSKTAPGRARYSEIFRAFSTSANFCDNLISLEDQHLFPCHCSIWHDIHDNFIPLCQSQNRSSYIFTVYRVYNWRRKFCRD